MAWQATEQTDALELYFKRLIVKEEDTLILDTAQELHWLNKSIERSQRIPPDCPCIKNPKPTDSTRFLSNIDQLDAIQRGNAKMNSTGSNSTMLNMNRIIGEGYRAGGGNREETSRAVIVRKNNQLLTAYPKL